MGGSSSEKTIRLFGEMSTKNKIYPEQHAKDCQNMRNYEEFAVSKRIESDN